MTGFIDRNGKFYRCEYQEHDKTALEIFGKRLAFLDGFIKVYEGKYWVEDGYTSCPLAATDDQLKHWLSWELNWILKILHDGKREFERGGGMKVRDCQKCSQYRRRTWSHKHYSLGYHPIGMTHAYGYCKKHDARCCDVKNCKEINGESK